MPSLSSRAVFQSTHPVRGATTMCRSGFSVEIFQSTHPVRGATGVRVTVGKSLAISIHTPRAGCDAVSVGRATRQNISIHAPRAGCDRERICIIMALTISIHAPRAGCDPLTPQRGRRAPKISIHAPRAGCDAAHNKRGGDARYFNPRTPCGVRLRFLFKGTMTCIFQSTHPVRGATADGSREIPRGAISIHAPRAGCDGVKPLPGTR